MKQPTVCPTCGAPLCEDKELIFSHSEENEIGNKTADVYWTRAHCPNDHHWIIWLEAEPYKDDWETDFNYTGEITEA